MLQSVAEMAARCSADRKETSEEIAIVTSPPLVLDLGVAASSSPDVMFYIGYPAGGVPVLLD